MRLKYTPTGSAKSYTYDFKPGEISTLELAPVERRTGMYYPDWVKACYEGSTIALHGFLFVMRKREIPELEWDQLQWTPDELLWEPGDEELRDMLAEAELLLKNPKLNAAEKRQVRERIEELRRELGEVDEEPVEAAEPSGPKGRSGGSARKRTTSRS